MKILAAVIIPPHMAVSGAVNASKALSRAVAEHCEVDIAIMAESNGESRLDRARLLQSRCRNWLSFTKPFLPNKFRTLFYRSDIPALVRQGDYDIVHLHNPMPALEMKRVALACMDAGIPYVISTHGYFEVTSGGAAYGLRNPILKQLWKWGVADPVEFTTRHAARIFALSPLDIPIVEALGVDRDRIKVVTNGVEDSYFEPVPEATLDATLAKLELEKSKDAPVSIYLGNHTANKGLPILIEAFRSLEEPFTLIVCGRRRAGVDYDGATRNLGPDQRILFTGFVSDEDIVALFQYSDLFVYPTLSDTLPLVVLEAMASGLPVLATDVGGISYQVQPGFGRLVAPGDPQAFAAAYREFVAEGGLAARGASARKYAQESFRWDRSAKLACAEYRALLSGATRN